MQVLKNLLKVVFSRWFRVVKLCEFKKQIYFLNPTNRNLCLSTTAWCLCSKYNKTLLVVLLFMNFRCSLFGRVTIDDFLKLLCEGIAVWSRFLWCLDYASIQPSLRVKYCRRGAVNITVRSSCFIKLIGTGATEKKVQSHQKSVIRIAVTADTCFRSLSIDSGGPWVLWSGISSGPREAGTLRMRERPRQVTWKTIFSVIESNIQVPKNLEIIFIMSEKKLHLR